MIERVSFCFFNLSLRFFSSKVPLSIFLNSISISHFAESMFLIFIIIPLIFLSSGPFKLSSALHLIINPISIVNSTIFIFHNPLTFSFALFKFSWIWISIRIAKFSITAFFIKLIISRKCCSIKPYLFPCPMPLITFPLSFVSTPTYRNILSIPVCFILFPLSIIWISIGMNQSSLAICYIIFKLSRIIAFIWEI